MAAGMGTVLVLLLVLVWLVGFVSKLSHWLSPLPAGASVAPAVADDLPSAHDELVSVIGAAVKAHRDRHGSH